MSAAPVRVARGEDLEAIVRIKRALAMSKEAQSASGGFLLGCDPGSYERLIAAERVHVLEEEGLIKGFITTLPDEIFRESEVWQRRESIAWEGASPQDFAPGRIAFLDQLAMQPEAQRQYHGALLAMVMMRVLIEREGHDHIFTTTLLEPVGNRAAIPLILKAGGELVGKLVECYPEVGQVCSAIHHIGAQAHLEAMRALSECGSPLERGVIAARDAAFSKLR